VDKVKIDNLKDSAIPPFVLLCFIVFALTSVTNWVLVSDDLYYDSFGEQLSFEKIKELINIGKQWNWLIYPILPLVYLVKVFLVTGCIFVGVLLNRYEIKFKTILRSVVIAEFIFLVPPIIKIFWFSIIEPNYTITDLQYFFPLSLLSIFEINELPPFLVYPMQALSIFEILYWIILAYEIHSISNESYPRALRFILLTYGSGFFLWLIFIVFLSVSASI
jgi:hypothetical protein